MNVMTSIYRYALALCMVAAAGALSAQNASTSSGVRRVGGDDKRPTSQAQVSDRMQMRQAADSRVPDDDAQWMKVVYRSLDLAKVPNASLYYPQEVVDGQENLFRIIMNRFASGELTAYEYLDGREMFTEQYRVNPVDVLERFHVPYTEAGSGARRRYVVEESDVPCNEVLSYYIIERWELDRSTTRMTTTVQALCRCFTVPATSAARMCAIPCSGSRWMTCAPICCRQRHLSTTTTTHRATPTTTSSPCRSTTAKSTRRATCATCR